ncbi:sigma factor [Lampropedia hyalina]|uniref:sigma factor n=1 Tax=Lampropedia hyalina TaxID=198706 RepID=UPI003898DE47
MPASPAPLDVQKLYGDHHRWLLAWLQHRLGNEFDAADLAHDVFIRLLSKNLHSPSPSTRSRTNGPISARSPRACASTSGTGGNWNRHGWKHLPPNRKTPPPRPNIRPSCWKPCRKSVRSSWDCPARDHRSSSMRSSRA